LPAGVDWYDFRSGELHTGGQDITVPAEWGRPPLFARAGSIVPLNLAEQHFARPADERGFALFPLRHGISEATSFEDDGETFAYASGQSARWTVRIEADAALRLTVTRGGSFGAVPKSVKLILPLGERRTVSLTTGRVASDHVSDGARVIEVAIVS
jgi:alpha-glucosidase